MHVDCKYLFYVCCSLDFNFHFRLTDCPPKLSHSPSELSEVTCSHDSIYIAGLYSVNFCSKQKINKSDSNFHLYCNFKDMYPSKTIAYNNGVKNNKDTFLSARTIKYSKALLYSKNSRLGKSI